MIVDQNPLALRIEDEQLADAIHDAVWMGEDDPEIFARAPGESAAEKRAEPPPRDAQTPREK